MRSIFGVTIGSKRAGKIAQPLKSGIISKNVVGSKTDGMPPLG